MATFSSGFSLTKYLFFYLNFTDVCWEGSNLEYVIIGSGNSLVLSRRQAIILGNDVLVCWGMYASHSLDELTHFRSWNN